MKKNLFLLVLLTLAAGRLGIAGTVAVKLNPASSVFTVGQIFSVDARANLPDPVLGFGIDIKFDPTLLSISSIAVGPSWFAAPGSEPDDIAGLAFPGAISGANVLLATVTFTALKAGSTNFLAGFNSKNLAEGFPLAAGGFDPSNLVDESAPVTVPEPSTLSSVGLGTLLAMFVRGRNSLRNRFVRGNP